MDLPIESLIFCSILSALGSYEFFAKVSDFSLRFDDFDEILKKF